MRGTEGVTISLTVQVTTAADKFAAHSVTEHSILYSASVFSPWQKCQETYKHILKALDEPRSCVFKRRDEYKYVRRRLRTAPI